MRKLTPILVTSDDVRQYVDEYFALGRKRQGVPLFRKMPKNDEFIECVAKELSKSWTKVLWIIPLAKNTYPHISLDRKRLTKGVLAATTTEFLYFRKRTQFERIAGGFPKMLRKKIPYEINDTRYEATIQGAYSAVYMSLYKHHMQFEFATRHHSEQKKELRKWVDLFRMTLGAMSLEEERLDGAEEERLNWVEEEKRKEEKKQKEQEKLIIQYEERLQEINHQLSKFSKDLNMLREQQRNLDSVLNDLYQDEELIVNIEEVLRQSENLIKAINNGDKIQNPDFTRKQNKKTDYIRRIRELVELDLDDIDEDTLPLLLDAIVEDTLYALEEKEQKIREKRKASLSGIKEELSNTTKEARNIFEQKSASKPLNKMPRDKINEMEEKRNGCLSEVEKQMELDDKMYTSRCYRVWSPEPWRDTTKKIIKISAELRGSYDEIHELWNYEPMTLKFSFPFEEDEHTYSTNLTYFQRIMVLNKVVLADKHTKISPAISHITGGISGSEATFKLFYYENDWYYTWADIDIDDAVALVRATEIRKQQKAQREKQKLQQEIKEAKMLLSGASEKGKRQRKGISKGVQKFVWNRDGGKCVQCGSNQKLEYDHIIPFSKGGSDTARNLQLLCEKCNREKGNSIG